MSEKFTRREREAMERYDSNDSDYSSSGHRTTEYKHKCYKCMDTGFYLSRGCDCDDPVRTRCDCKETLWQKLIAR